LPVERAGLPLFEWGIEVYVRQLNNAPEDINVAFNLAVTRVWTPGCRRDVHDLNGVLASYSASVVMNEWRESEKKLPRSR